MLPMQTNRKPHGSEQFRRSTTIAWPIPPATHIVSRPIVPSSASRLLSSVVMIRAPVMPNGWPSAIAPPNGLSFSGSMPHSSRHGTTWAANASLSSSTSMSSIVMPACSSTFSTAGIGPRPMISGRIAATEEAMMRARGFSPSSCARSSDITSTAAAPSLSGQALPAVTVPPRA